MLEPGPVGVRTLVRRLMLHGGMGDLHVDLQVAPEGEDEDVRAPVVFVGIEGSDAKFDLYESRSRQETLGFLCFEVGSAYRARHRLDEQRTAYRDQIIKDPAVVEQLAAVTAVYLGFGVLAANAAHSYEAGGSIDGYQVHTHWRHSFAGGLPWEVLVWALALIVVVRGDRDDVAVIEKRLSSNQAEAFRSASAELATERAAHRKRLGLPHADEWPDPSVPDLAMLPIEEADAELEEEERDLEEELAEIQTKRRRTRLVYRVRSRQKLGGALPFLLGLSLGVYALVASWSGLIWVGLLGAAAFLAATYLYIGTGRLFVCSDSKCLSKIPEYAKSCPGCGFHVSGEVSSHAEALDLPRYGSE